MPRHLTRHASSRLQQRGIPADALRSLLTFGRTTHDHQGASIVFLDHRSRDRIRRTMGAAAYQRIEPHLDTYAVVSQDGSIVTVGHRTQRINRN